MEPSYLREQIERLQPQISLEKDPAAQHEMRATYRHLHKQYRKATRHTEPWHGLKRNLIFLGTLFAVLVYAILHLSKTYGWPSTVAVSSLTAVIILLFISVFLLLKGVISPQRFESLVKECFQVFRWLRGGERTSSNNELAAPARKSRTTAVPVPEVTFDNRPTLPAPKVEAPDEK